MFLPKLFKHIFIWLNHIIITNPAKMYSSNISPWYTFHPHIYPKSLSICEPATSKFIYKLWYVRTIKLWVLYMQLIYFLNDKIFCLISNICFWHFSIIQEHSCKFHHQVGYLEVLMHFFFSYIARLIKFVAYLYPPQNNTSYDNLYKLCHKLYFTQVFISHNNLYFWI